MLWRITVQQESDPTGFDPSDREIQSADSVFWFNADHHTEHQPYPIAGSPTTWFKTPISPQATSDQVRFAVAGSYAYACALHPDETGTIEVAAVVQIGQTFDGPAAFVPKSINLPQNRSIVWNNSDMNAHRPMPKGGPEDEWLEENIEPGDSSPPVAFDEVGTFPYVCALHPTETGTIVVYNVQIATASNVTSFAPKTKSIELCESIVWLNSTTASHQPMPAGGPADAWLAQPIVANATSPAVPFETAGDIPYECALHPSETGTIQVK
ncbi:MAG: cupredoxin domain-containing protein [Thermoanaerobaculia bacterium]